MNSEHYDLLNMPMRYFIHLWMLWVKVESAFSVLGAVGRRCLFLLKGILSELALVSREGWCQMRTKAFVGFWAFAADFPISKRFASQADWSYCHCCCMGAAYYAAAAARTPFPHLPLLSNHRLASSPPLSSYCSCPIETQKCLHLYQSSSPLCDMWQLEISEMHCFTPCFYLLSLQKKTTIA